MVYRDVLVCCNSIEVNVVSDVSINLCLSQIKLALHLFGEFNEFLQPVKTSKTKIRFPYSTPSERREESDLEATKDSGIESSEFKSVGSSFKHVNMQDIVENVHVCHLFYIRLFLFRIFIVLTARNT